MGVLLITVDKAIKLLCFSFIPNILYLVVSVYSLKVDVAAMIVQMGLLHFSPFERCVFPYLSVAQFI
jgi:hypothetical protein